MTTDERLTRLETIVEKQTEGIQGLIVVSRTMLTAMEELQAKHKELAIAQKEMIEETRESRKHLDEKLNILIDTVDRIIRHLSGNKEPRSEN